MDKTGWSAALGPKAGGKSRLKPQARQAVDQVGQDPHLQEHDAGQALADDEGVR